MGEIKREGIIPKTTMSTQRGTTAMSSRASISFKFSHLVLNGPRNTFLIMTRKKAAVISTPIKETNVIYRYCTTWNEPKKHKNSLTNPDKSGRPNEAKQAR